ncbi:MAG: glycosyltransferase N-terminal domain-containing protein [Pseudorhodobacter sp.]|nr:glycosyltransferase N-terminal domain-containing protein [Pseudorhodobacter sp.]
MTYSLGLTLYNLASRRATGLSADRPARPEGRLIWLHAPQADAACAMTRLAGRLQQEGGYPVLLTCPVLPDPMPGVIMQPPPADSQAEVRAFLEYWHPDIALMSDGELRPAMLHAAQERGVALLMVNARAPHMLPDRDGWYPGLMKASLGVFRQVLAVDEVAAHAFRKAGATADQVQVTGRLEQGSAALPCTEAERAELARLLGTRPVWLATCLPEAEESAVIEAHRAALRLAHRLLLIVVPQNQALAGDLAKRMEDVEGWQVARRAADQEPDAETEVYIADAPVEYGLWYRLAPIAYMGGSLSASGCLRNPLEAAALGAAIIHGPRFGDFAGIFGRLGTARATRSVAGAPELVEALGDLLSPDRAARLAQAAWGVASEGVEASDRLVAMIRKILRADA